MAMQQAPAANQYQGGMQGRATLTKQHLLEKRGSNFQKTGMAMLKK